MEKEYRITFDTTKLTSVQLAEITVTANEMDKTAVFQTSNPAILFHIHTNNIYLCRKLRNYKVIFKA